jgi:hypothetical protein
MSDYMIALNSDGSLKSAGPIEDELDADPELEKAAKEDIKESKEQISTEENKGEDKASGGNLVKDEEKSEGRISKRAMFSFFK